MAGVHRHVQNPSDVPHTQFETDVLLVALFQSVVNELYQLQDGTGWEW